MVKKLLIAWALLATVGVGVVFWMNAVLQGENGMLWQVGRSLSADNYFLAAECGKRLGKLRTGYVVQ